MPSAGSRFGRLPEAKCGTILRLSDYEKKEMDMTRLIILALLGYGAYRVARHFIRGVPSDFEPILLAPASTPKTARVHARQGGRK